MPDPQPVPRSGRSAASGWTAWHPTPAVLDLVELVLDGALARLPEGLTPAGGRIIEDAEGTPVAALAEDGSLGALRPFSHPPVRSQRLTPAQVRSRLTAGASEGAADGEQTPAGPVLAVPVCRALTVADVERLQHLIAGTPGPAARLLWLVPVGADRSPASSGGLTAEALLRAVRDLAAQVDRTRLDGRTARDAAAAPHAEPLVVPVGLPAGYDHLVEEVARAYGADGVLRPAEPVRGSGPSPLHAAFAVELSRGAALPRHGRGLVVFFTGLSGSGKSTVAKALAERVLDGGLRTVSLLDGDEVRRLLSAGLGFSRADREANIARIGFVAAEVARHGGMAIAAPIAPFARGRAEVREMVERVGADLVLVHVATPLAECERRDRKGLYARARSGEVAEFTGISSPYEEPPDADVVLDTTGRTVPECVEQVWQVLEQRGWLVEGDHAAGQAAPRGAGVRSS